MVGRYIDVKQKEENIRNGLETLIAILGDGSITVLLNKMNNCGYSESDISRLKRSLDKYRKEKSANMSFEKFLDLSEVGIRYGITPNFYIEGNNKELSVDLRKEIECLNKINNIELYLVLKKYF